MKLGAIYSKEKTTFTLFSPVADSVFVIFYDKGNDSAETGRLEMMRGEGELRSIFSVTAEGNLDGVYYTYEVHTSDGTFSSHDPYARACGVNGHRSMVIDLSKTNPYGFADEDRPKLADPMSMVITEVSVADVSAGASAHSRYPGKFKAFTEDKTLSYFKDMGVTHLQLMPSYDFASIDESDSLKEQYNWGYDPYNYNVPEGSYSTDPFNGAVRVREYKEMVHSIHEAGLGVIMDVVYNHMYSLDNNLNRTVPWYYFRTDKNGEISNGSACGNDVASERPMCARYILDSVIYWVREYHIDGFRFDLMGLLDVELMNRIRRELDTVYGEGEILIYGEPWAADVTAMEDGAAPALKSNIQLLDKNVGMFCDDTRDAIKGHVFEAETPGFVNGAEGMEDKILDSVTAWCGNDSVKAPSQIITYVSAHDNWTLWDKLEKTISDEKQREKVNRLAAAIYMTCQGNLFFLSGEEFARTKDGYENTYNASIALNRLDWERAYEYQELRQYYQGLIALRKQLPGLCDKSEEAWKRISGQWKEDGAVGFLVDNRDEANTCPWKKLLIIYNRTEKTVTRELPEGNWEILLNGENSFLWKEPKNTQKAEAAPVSALILGQR